MMDGFSYSECFLSQIPGIKDDKNCITLVYDFSYNGRVKMDANAFFIGVFEYEFWPALK